MGKSSLYGNMGRYNAIAPTFVDGESGALQVDSSGSLLTTTVSPVGVGTAKDAKYGQPGRYSVNYPVLQDGEMTSLLLDENGQVVIA